VGIETRAEDEFRLTPEALRKAITPRTKCLILPYPNNPTGGIMEKADLEKIAEVVREHQLIVLNDEIYGELTYNGLKHVSFASLPGMWEYTITLNGFSKAFAMTGWRVGFACGPEAILAVMLKIHQYTIMCASRMGQVAALEALRNGRSNDYEDVRRMRESYDRRRRLMVEGFRAMGLECFEPRGAFYVFPSIKSTGLTSEEFCNRLLMEHKIACVPGTAFGASGEGHIRCSYATSIDKLSIALERMDAFIKSL
jgi:aminotransferase